MNKKFINDKNLYTTVLIIFSFYVNYYYANIGVLPIDTFAFFDTGYNIILDRHPFKDIWVTTGPFVDYLQALFFKIFGINWLSYVIHGSLINSLATYILFKTLVDLNFNKFLSFVYSLGFELLLFYLRHTICLLTFLCIFTFGNFNFFFMRSFTKKKIVFFVTFCNGYSFFKYAKPININ